MPTFEYIALDRAGKQTRGSISAESASAARRQLRNRRLHATKMISISEAAHIGRFEWGKLFRGRRRRLVLEFTRQLATLIGADIQLTESLDVLISQGSDAKFTQILQNIRDQVLSGEALADTLKDYPGWFDAIYVAMVRIGEVTGNLGRSLKLLAEHISKRQRLEAKIKSALTYPMILVVIATLVTIVLMTFVVPKITGMLKDSGKEVPWITQALMNVSDLLIHWWWLFLLLFAGLAWLFKRSLETTKGRMAFDRAILSVPVIGEMLRQGVMARFTSTLAALIRSGLPVAEGLTIVADVIGNSIMTKALRAARERIVAGTDIATPLRKSGVVTPTVAHMISVGERTGELENMLISVAESIEESTDITVQRVSSVIEPCIIVVLAIVVGIIVGATLLPILQVSDIG